jgi:superfamily II DNA/RNA helicase
VATDVAARGLDIPDVHCVLHFDAPQDPSNFVHRCGRTARMGRSGRAIALLTPEEDIFVELMKQRNVPMTLVPAPDGLGLPLVEEEEGQKGSGDTVPADESTVRSCVNSFHSLQPAIQMICTKHALCCL